MRNPTKGNQSFRKQNNTTVTDLIQNTLDFIIGNMCVCIVLGSIALVGLALLSFQFHHTPLFSFFNYPLVYTSFLGWSIYALFKRGREYLEFLQLQSITRTKQLERRETLERYKKEFPMTPERLHIVKLPVEQLVIELKHRRISAADCLSAFIAKTVEATISTNCVTEFILHAMDIADDLDVMDDVKGPLHGLPVCIKDDTNCKGMDSTLGYAKNLYQPATESAVLVRALEELGAIPFCKTNVPQTLVSYASDNPVFGKTLNPINPKLAPGGSSSGTGALVAAGGCPFGTGTDIGGSGRIPAHFNGISSLKPSSNRLSGKGVCQATPNCVGLVGVPTIFAKKPRMVARIFKALTENGLQNRMDPLALPIPWDQHLFSSKTKLRIGYFTSLKFFPAMGDTAHTVLKAKSTFESLGHTVIPFDLPVSDTTLAKLTADLCNADTGNHLRKELRAEKISDAAKMVNQLINMPFWLRKLLSMVVKWKYMPMIRSVRAAYCLLAGLDLRSTVQLWAAIGEKSEVIRAILDKMDAEELDLILCPCFPFCAPKIDDAKDLIVAVIYCIIWNLTDFPAGVVQVGTESCRRIDEFNDEGDMFLKIAKKSIRSSKDMPIGVQIVGRPYKEELVLRAMVELDESSRN